MNKQFTYEDILRAKEVHLYRNDTLFVVDADGEAYGFHEGGSEWYHKENFWDYFESSIMMSYLSRVTKEEAGQLYLTWTNDSRADSSRLNRAIVYAVECHAGQLRKGTLCPYITHPLETMQILRSMGADTDLLIAGVLHDTIEDTEATEQDIRERFGDDVVALITAHSEDKSKTWEERKSFAIKELAKADKRLKMLVMADKVANLRNMASDFARIGNELWNRFNAPPNKQAWYYSGIQESLYDMQSYPECAQVYWEMVNLYKDVFVRFFIDSETQTLYQLCLDGTGYRFEKGDPVWKKLTEKVPERAQQLTRLLTERIEDCWSDCCMRNGGIHIKN